MRGYIAMLAVKKEHRGKGIATKLVRMAIDAMILQDADEVIIKSSSSPLTPLPTFSPPQRNTNCNGTKDCTRDRD
jgi:peptide alpha-N-acetyltransferase